MIELASSHPSLAELSLYLENVEHGDGVDSVSIHVEDCVECQQQLTEMLCNNSDSANFFDAIRDDSNSEKPSWLNLNRTALERQLESGHGEQSTTSTTSQRQSTRYRLIEEVARGGMGIVFRAADRDFDREVAVKVIANNHVDVNRFEREARISGQLQHPGIVPIHDFGVLQNGEPFIAMKLVEGKTLREILDSGLMSEPRLLEVFSQVCQTVAYSHSQCVVHRDLKPANIMVGEYGEVQIMDWGLAKKVDSPNETGNFKNELASQPVLAGETIANNVHDTAGVEISRPEVDCLAVPNETLCGTVIGTPAYMPLEQALGRPVGLTVDVFALGGILCEILTDQPPFVRTDENRNVSIASRFENKDCQLDQSLARLDLCSADPALVELAKHCLAREASSRPANAAIVSARLTEFTEGRDQRLKEVELERASSTARLQVETKRRKQVFRLAAVIATVLLATTLATALYLTERNARQAELFFAEKTSIEERAATESRIRSIMSAAQAQLQRASVAANADKVSGWQNANVEIQRAFEIVDSVSNRELLKDLNSLDRDIQSGLNLAQLRQTRIRNEKQVADAINKAIKQSTYPNNNLMKGKAKQEVAQSLEAAFANFGVACGSDVTEAATKIRNSSIQETLISALRTWQLQHRYNQSGELENIEWFENLMNAVDPDEFRVRVRELISQRDASKVKEVVSDPEALESVANVHAVYDYLRPAGEKKKLLNFLKRAHCKFPNDYVINDTLFVLHRHFHPLKPELGLRHALICLAIQPDNPRVLLHVSSLYLALGDNDSAIDVCNRMIEMFPSLPQAYINAGNALSNKKEFEEAVESYELAIKVAPRFDKAYYNFGILLNNLGQSREAVDMMKKAIELNPDFSQYHIAHCNLLLSADKKDAAEEAVLRGLELQPSNLEGLQNIIKLTRDRGDFDEAIEFHKLQVKYHKHKTTTWAGYAETLFAAERYKEAEELIERHFNAHFQPRYADVLARAQWAQDKKDDAIATLELQIQKRPNSLDARKLLRKYNAELAD